ncbi:MAG: putative DNA-binding protein [Anaeromicrobium sp.]|jgi:predicted DNA-binding protein YlxM (UPF0122 family)|uniref:YlxM family DNA-binding protein n=1 Tax=Anaeromicrobium sp. TaxID=1929132 RepID=UPI0025F5F972|nr:putative DNA-binding protein [Anaeromicrobium sp.]MCT4594869.1 putative DNA-binding protein [Anaeromicrobium sp.]
MVDKILEVSLLYDFYGQLLTSKQQDVLQLYYYHDLSLGEISEQLSVSRQAVYDNIKRAEKLLKGYEEKLKLVEKFLFTKRNIECILESIRFVESKVDDKDKELLDKIDLIKEIASNVLDV